MISLNHIDQSEALRYLGYGNEKPSESVSTIINECEIELLKAISAKYLYRSFNIEKKNGNIFLENCKLTLKGIDINTHLKECDKVILMCATLSSEVDKLIRITQIKDMARAVIMDSLASAAIEQVCNLIEEQIKGELPTSYMTWRYSPGYGDLDISIEKDFLDVLNAPKNIGLCTNESNILIPKKSVTAIIGVSKKQINLKKRGCQSCNLKESCSFRRKGEHCGL